MLCCVVLCCVVTCVRLGGAVLKYAGLCCVVLYILGCAAFCSVLLGCDMLCWGGLAFLFSRCLVLCSVRIVFCY